MATGGGDDGFDPNKQRRNSEKLSVQSKKLLNPPQVPGFDEQQLEIAAISIELLEHIINQGVEQRELPPESEDVVNEEAPAVNPREDWRSRGEVLKELADKFSECQERQRVRQLAEETNLDSLDEQYFFNMLDSLFLEGLSIERFLALFTYICDLGRVAYRQFGGDLARYLKLFHLVVKSFFKWLLKLIWDKRTVLVSIILSSVSPSSVYSTARHAGGYVLDVLRDQRVEALVVLSAVGLIFAYRRYFR